jgi:hypothetical protein
MTDDNENFTMHPMAMPADIPQDMSDLAHHLLQQALQKADGKIHPGNVALVCIVVASAFIAVVDDDDDRELILDSIGDIASMLVEVNREVEAAAAEQNVSLQEIVERANATGDVEPPTEH